MGMPPAGYVHGHAWYATESYGVVDAAKVMNWEPIVSMQHLPSSEQPLHLLLL